MISGFANGGYLKKNGSLVSNFKPVEVPLTAWRVTSTCWKFFLQLSMNGFLRAGGDQKIQRKESCSAVREDNCIQNCLQNDLGFCNKGFFSLLEEGKYPPFAKP
jgi:hypothetical protein